MSLLNILKPSYESTGIHPVHGEVTVLELSYTTLRSGFYMEVVYRGKHIVEICAHRSDVAAPYYVWDGKINRGDKNLKKDIMEQVINLCLNDRDTHAIDFTRLNNNHEMPSLLLEDRETKRVRK